MLVYFEWTRRESGVAIVSVGLMGMALVSPSTEGVVFVHLSETVAAVGRRAMLRVLDELAACLSTLALTTLVVVLFEDIGGRVRPIGHDLLGRPLSQHPRDGTTPDAVWGSR